MGKNRLTKLIITFFSEIIISFLTVFCLLTQNLTETLALISRSTKLVIIERLLLLAERYVITIEVFDCTMCQVVTDTIDVIILVSVSQNVVFFEIKAVVSVCKFM